MPKIDVRMQIGNTTMALIERTREPMSRDEMVGWAARVHLARRFSNLWNQD